VRLPLMVVLIGSILGSATFRSEPIGAQPASPAPVKIGVVGSLFHKMPEVVVQIALRPLKNYLEAQTGLTGEVIIGGDAFSVSQKLRDNHLQLGVFHGIEFAWAKQKNTNLRPLIIAVNRHPALHAVLVVRDSCKAGSYHDLKGKVVAIPTMNKEHCRLFFEGRCVKPGQKPREHYREVTAPGNEGEALADVADGEADATVVDRVALEQYRAEHPAQARKLKIIQESEQFPCGVVAYDATKLDEATVKLFRSSLLAAKDSTAGQVMLKAIRITGFEEVPADYDAQLANIVTAYPPPR
jgi:ABC-type phosphate/phosphonate transport system substrate-binding protein